MHSTEQALRAFCFTLVFFTSSNLLCALTVREHLRVRWYVVVVFVLVETAATVALRSIHWLLSIPLVFLCLWVYCKVVDVKPLTLIYIELIVVAHQVIANDILYLFEGSSYTWSWADMPAVLVVFGLTTPVMYWLLRVKLWPRLRDIRVDHAGWLPLVPLAFIAMNLLLSSSHIQYMLSDELTLPYILLTMVFSLTTAGTCLIMLAVLERTQDVAIYESNMRLMDVQVSAEAKRFAELTRYMNDVRVLRHDMRHHLILLQMMLEAEQYDEARAYLQHYNDETGQQEAMRFSANMIGDLIARLTQLRAQAADIDVDIQCALPADCWISDTDLCVVLGNLTENALNACKLQQEGRKYLRATARIVGGTEAVFTIENSCSDGDDGPAAREAVGAAPSNGLGIPSIRAVAEKYHGTARFERQGNVHTAIVLLYAPVAPKAVQQEEAAGAMAAAHTE